MSNGVRSSSSLRAQQAQMRKTSQPDLPSGREQTSGEDPRAKTSLLFRALDPSVSPKRGNICKTPQPQAKSSGLNRSFSRSTSLVSTAARQSTEKKKSDQRISPFFRKDYKPNPARERTSYTQQNSPRPLSETVKERFNEINKAKKESKEVGREALVNASQKRDLALQVQALENRIKKLKQEEERMLQKINETIQKTEKVTDIKKRRTGDLFHKAKKKEEENLELIRKKQEIAKERENKKLSLKQSAEENLRIKQEVASGVKQDNKLNKSIKEKNQETETKKNKELINRIKVFEKSLILSKLERGKELKTDLSQYYLDKIQNDKEEADSLGKKLKDLTNAEEQLVSRLNQTYGIQKLKYDELEKIFNLRVSTPNLLEQSEPGQENDNQNNNMQ